MRRWKPTRPRELDERQARQILASGGLLLRRRRRWLAFRTQDCRRMQVGIVPDALVAALEDEGFAERGPAAPSRISAAPSVRR